MIDRKLRDTAAGPRSRAALTKLCLWNRGERRRNGKTVSHTGGGLSLRTTCKINLHHRFFFFFFYENEPRGCNTNRCGFHTDCNRIVRLPIKHCVNTVFTPGERTCNDFFDLSNKMIPTTSAVVSVRFLFP